MEVQEYFGEECMIKIFCINQEVELNGGGINEFISREGQKW